MTFDSFHERYMAAQQRWGANQFHDRLFTLQSMAAGRMKWEPSDVIRAQQVLARFEQLNTAGLDKVASLRQAEQEHPPVRRQR